MNVHTMLQSLASGAGDSWSYTCLGVHYGCILSEHASTVGFGFFDTLFSCKCLFPPRHVCHLNHFLYLSLIFLHQASRNVLKWERP